MIYHSVNKLIQNYFLIQRWLLGWHNLCRPQWKIPLGKNTYNVYLDATGLAAVSKEVFNAIGGAGGAGWPPKLRVGRSTGGGLGRLDCVGWKIGGGGGQRQAGKGGRENGDQRTGWWQRGTGFKGRWCLLGSVLMGETCARDNFEQISNLFRVRGVGGWLIAAWWSARDISIFDRIIHHLIGNK